MEINNLFLFGCVLALTSNYSFAESNSFNEQSYIKSGIELIGSFNKCKLINVQHGDIVKKCLSDSSSQIAKERNKLFTQNQNLLKNASKFGPMEFNNPKVEALKNKCATLYPVALQSNFSNQILQCKVQIELMQYMKDSAQLVEFGRE